MHQYNVIYTRSELYAKSCELTTRESLY